MSDDSLYYEILDNVIAKVLTHVGNEISQCNLDPKKKIQIVFTNIKVTNKEHMALFHIAKILEAYQTAFVYGSFKWYQRLYLRLYYGKNVFAMPKKTPTENCAYILTDNYLEAVKSSIDELQDYPTLLKEIYHEFYDPRAKKVED